MLSVVERPNSQVVREKIGGMNGQRIGLWLAVAGGLALYPAIQYQEGVSTTLPEYILLYGAVLALGFGIAIWGLSTLRTLTAESTT